jgi:hypothetical protein
MLSYLVVEHSPMGTVLKVRALTGRDFGDYVLKNGDTVIEVTAQPDEDKVTVARFYNNWE